MNEKRCEDCHFHIRGGMCRWARGPFEDGSGADHPTWVMREVGGQCGPRGNAWQPRRWYSAVGDLAGRVNRWWMKDVTEARRRDAETKRIREETYSRVNSAIDLFERDFLSKLDALERELAALKRETKAARDEAERKDKA